MRSDAKLIDQYIKQNKNITKFSITNILQS